MSDFPTELSEQQILNRAFDKTTNTLKFGGGSSAGTGVVDVNEVTAHAGENIPQDVLGTIFKPTINSAYTPLVHQNAGAATTANIKTTAGAVFSIRVSNRNAATRYFQLHNRTIAPIATDAAQTFYELAPNAILQLGIDDFGPSEYFSAGIGWAISTTAAAFTDAATASEHTVTVKYL